MSTLVHTFLPELTTEPRLEPDDLIRNQVWDLLGGRFPRRAIERRTEQRFAYPQLLYLSPVEADGVATSGPPVVVVGKHLSERGLGFFHNQPIAQRRMIASLQAPNGLWSGFLIDLAWCRFTQHGWYDSGGRFLAVVPSPLATTA
jgi:hypothetical protein